MPRRSAADISIMPMLPGRGRPPPPKALDQTEARAWNDIVDAMPGQWVDLAAQMVLRRLVCQIAIAERLEARLRKLAGMAKDATDVIEFLEIEHALAAVHRETAKSVIHGMTALRATPRSRMAPREGRSRFERGAGAFRPWDIVAKRNDGQAS
jgi:hypothetical protein